MIRRGFLAAGGAVVSIASFRTLTRRAARRLLEAPRVLPEEAGLRPALDALGGEVVRVRARDGLRLSGRWLEGEPGGPNWVLDPREAIVLLHGWSGSVAPHLVECGPFLRRTAGVLGLDSRGHGESDDSPTTFGLREVEDVAGALSWLGERGVERVALVGMSMGGITAIASVAVLGDGSLAGTDVDVAAPAYVPSPRRPRIVAIVADSVSPDLPSVAVPSIPGPARRIVAARLFDAVARTIGDDPRATEPIRVIGLLEGVPLLLISGEADPIVTPEAARRLAAAAPPGTELWTVPGAGHRGAHGVAPGEYETRVTRHVRVAFLGAREAAL
ncbi:MAG: alpha/beta fold hydrolase [Chloroflexi bacterium]|nr:alpha/beta fold hydrolase [Chloroflexota bacterium]